MGDLRAVEAEKLVQQCRSLSQRVATYNQKVAYEGDALAEEIKLLQKSIKQVQAEQDESPQSTEALNLAVSILKGHGPGGDLRKLCKQANPPLLALLLGSRTNVVTLQRNQSIRLKEEYHSFRDRTGIFLFLFGAALLWALSRARAHVEANEPLSLTPPIMVGVQVFLCWLLYIYTAMALRENVLKVNGSNIRPWWIHHHYWSIATCLLLLMLPVDSPAVQFCVRKTLWWSALQGLVMVLQNRYQRRRMYTRIALGKNAAMDVVSGESSGGYGQLLMLYPLLFGLQALQVWIGGEMVMRTWQSLLSPEGWLDEESHESDLRGSRGVCLAGLLMLYMGTCNFKNTIATILEKSATRRRARYRQGPKGQ